MLRVYQTWRYSAARLPIRRIPIRAQQATSASMSSKQMKSEHEGHLLQVRSAAAAYTVTAVATASAVAPMLSVHLKQPEIVSGADIPASITTVTHLLVPHAACQADALPLCWGACPARCRCMHAWVTIHYQSNMSYKCSEGHRRLQVSKDFDGVLTSRSTKELDSILDSNVTLHKGASHPSARSFPG